MRKKQKLTSKIKQMRISPFLFLHLFLKKEKRNQFTFGKTKTLSCENHASIGAATLLGTIGKSSGVTGTLNVVKSLAMKSFVVGMENSPATIAAGPRADSQSSAALPSADDWYSMSYHGSCAFVLREF